MCCPAIGFTGGQIEEWISIVFILMYGRRFTKAAFGGHSRSCGPLEIEAERHSIAGANAFSRSGC
jgi:hypothetical protein